jgi:hypothetical protein
MYDKKIVKDILKKSNCETVDDFLELIYKYVDQNCFPADYELYGNFCYKYYKDSYKMVDLKYNMYGRDGRNYNKWTISEIQKLIEHNKDKDSISFHLWGLN